jgi:desulfoferrodoxin-like iron-binding protein
MMQCNLLVLSSIFAVVAAFQAPSSLYRPSSSTRLLAKKSTTHQEDNDTNNNTNLSAWTTRRNAVVKGSSFLAAALAAAGTPPALASDIAKQVAQLDKEFGDTVNTNGAPEKHIPQVTLSKSSTRSGITGKVKVLVPHVMDAEKPHWIQAIWLKEEKTGDVAVAKVMPATEPSSPTLEREAPKGARLTPMLYCNLHGLWKGDTFTVV